ncbi:hypothetical protein [Spongiactinospora sp. TRM90649]|uniref:hypothetical protein n=1 Tax=Spongiactinospora sp. TRM90649 TaxID=3031114 RepID=UPI0023F9063C|nr:hypothetical protein [Spongiactinospora sp. TRM90649]MDF5756596.1 hypothetical protein [Spongiactinospora sp. TRM90649]
MIPTQEHGESPATIPPEPFPPMTSEGDVDLPDFQGDTITHLQDCMTRAIRSADHFAQQSAERRRIAEDHLRAAAAHQETAVHYRMAAGEWQALITFVAEQRTAAERARSTTGPHTVIPIAQDDRIATLITNAEGRVA